MRACACRLDVGDGERTEWRPRDGHSKQRRKQHDFDQDLRRNLQADAEQPLGQRRGLRHQPVPAVAREGPSAGFRVAPGEPGSGGVPVRLHHHGASAGHLHPGVRGGPAVQRAGPVGAVLPRQTQEALDHLHDQPGRGRPDVHPAAAPEDHLPPARQRLAVRQGGVPRLHHLVLRQHVLLHPAADLHQRGPRPRNRLPDALAAVAAQPLRGRGVRRDLAGRAAVRRASAARQPAGVRRQPGRHHLLRRAARRQAAELPLLLLHGAVRARLPGAVRRHGGLLRAHHPLAGAHAQERRRQQAGALHPAGRAGAPHLRAVLRAQQRGAAAARRADTLQGRQRPLHRLHAVPELQQPQQLSRPVRLLLHVHRVPPQARLEGQGARQERLRDVAQIFQQLQHSHDRRVHVQRCQHQVKRTAAALRLTTPRPVVERGPPYTAFPLAPPSRGYRRAGATRVIFPPAFCRAGPKPSRATLA